MLEKAETKKRDSTATEVAKIFGKTSTLVRMVVNGKRKNAAILESYNRLKAEKEVLVERMTKNIQEA